MLRQLAAAHVSADLAELAPVFEEACPIARDGVGEFNPLPAQLVDFCRIGDGSLRCGLLSQMRNAWQEFRCLPNRRAHASSDRLEERPTIPPQLSHQPANPEALLQDVAHAFQVAVGGQDAALLGEIELAGRGPWSVQLTERVPVGFF